VMDQDGYTVSDEVHGQRATWDSLKRPFRGPLSRNKLPE
jgi:hypothetical protein